MGLLSDFGSFLGDVGKTVTSGLVTLHKEGILDSGGKTSFETTDTKDLASGEGVTVNVKLDTKQLDPVVREPLTQAAGISQTQVLTFTLIAVGAIFAISLATGRR